jgi:hypothetical protein
MYLMYLRFQAQGGWGAAKYRYDTSSHDVLLLAGAWSGWWRGVWHEVTQQFLAAMERLLIL